MAESAQASYDLFVSYAEADRAWVEGYLLDALEAAGVHAHSEAAFRLGAPRLLEFERAVQGSQRTLLVLTPAYLAEGWNEFLRLVAQSYDLDQEAWRVIPLRLEPVDLPPALAALQALDATDPAERDRALERLCADLQRPVPAPEPPSACPYPGMRPFSEKEKDCFFGRDAEVVQIVKALRKHPFLAVIGPSGSGKSSLVFAGLVPKLRESGLFGGGSWQVIPLRPGKTPAQSLADTIKGDVNQPAQAISDLLSSQPGARRLLLVVDQFEELFTQADAGEVVPFQEALLRLTDTPGCYVVLTVRADFFSELMTSKLWPQIERHRAEVLPLDEEGLRQAIVLPAERSGVFVDPVLMERLVSDAAGEPGLLPFVQETLVQLWEKLERRYLPLSAYDEMSDLRAAMAQHADEVLATLMAEEEAIAKRTLLRLVQFGEGRADTRRQQAVAELRSSRDDATLFDRTLDHLVKNRLITLGGAEKGEKRWVDLAHEALIEGWPKLHGWVVARREAEQTRRRLEAKAQDWVRLREKGGGLLDEVELREAQEWLESPDSRELGGASDDLEALVEASSRAIEAAEQQKEVARREAEAAALETKYAQETAQAATQTAGRLRRRAIALGLALVVVIALALLAILIRAGYREWVRLTTGTELVPIAGGPAIIGTDDPAAEPTVTLLRFQIEKYEVSNAQWRACVESGPCTKPRVTDRFDDEAWGDYPVVEITARQAHVYCTWLGRRLPTTIEWERAARGTVGRLWPWGKDPVPVGYEFPIDAVPVASDPETATPPPEQIYHLAYNVSEWVVRVPADCDGASCHQAWDGKADSIARIGRAYDRPMDHVAHVAAMVNYFPDAPDESTGFRCAADSLP